MKTIDITVARDGSTTVETKGFQGSDCLQASRALEEALGVRGPQRTTPEFHHTARHSTLGEQTN